MAYTVDWYLEKRILMARLWGDTTDNDFPSLGETLATLLNTGDDPYVHCIIDMLEIDRAPTRLAELQQAMNPMLAHPLLGWSLPLINDPTQRYLCTMLAQMYKVRWREMETKNEAINFLIETDKTLPPILHPAAY